MTKTIKVFALPLAFASLAAAGIVTLTTNALFTDRETAELNSFTAGTVNLALDPGEAVLVGSNLAPGDSLVGRVTVQNQGSLAYRYSVVGRVDQNIGWIFTAKTGVVECNEVGFGESGTVLYEAEELTSSPTPMVGDPTPGQQAGDRLLAASDEEDLCVRAHLPLTAGNAVQDKSVTATFTFAAEQTANNG